MALDGKAENDRAAPGAVLIWAGIGVLEWVWKYPRMWIGRYKSAGGPWVQRFIFPGYLVFTVCFYSYRFLLGYGSPLTTTYDQDAPTWLRVAKDITWLFFLALVAIFSRPCDWTAARNNLRRNWRFGLLLFALVMTFAVMGWIHLFFYQSVADTMLYWFRYPLEYIPVVFVLPMLVDRWDRLGKLAVALGWISILFLIYEMFSGREVGFFGVRYGSLLGSPNDFGIFCGLLILGLLVFGRSKSHWILGVLLVVGLVLTVSRSAMAGFLGGLLVLLYLKRVRFAAMVGLAVAAMAIGLLVWSPPNLEELPQPIPLLISHAIAHFDVTDALDESALLRVDELHTFRDRFGELEIAPLLVGTDYFHVENWYLALVIRTGVLGLGLWLVAIGATVRRGWRLRRSSRLHAVATAAVSTMAVASAFIPYPDAFPTNLYFWLAVGLVWLPESQKLEDNQVERDAGKKGGKAWAG